MFTRDVTNKKLIFSFHVISFVSLVTVLIDDYSNGRLLVNIIHVL